jgi:iron complex outermembrane receptor protein
MKQSRKGMLMAALICGTIVPVLFGGTSAYAAEAEEEALATFYLNPMVITAQRA